MKEAKPVTGSVRLTTLDNGETILQIKTAKALKAYLIEQLDSHPEIGCPAYILHLKDGSHSSYEIVVRPWGAECSCPDFAFRREHIDPKGCKHIAALRAVGLLTKSQRNDSEDGTYEDGEDSVPPEPDPFPDPPAAADTRGDGGPDEPPF